MWSVRILSGDLSGKVYPLKMGSNILGRAPHCDVTLPLSSISKEHIKIEVYNDKLIITDMNSRNGTFINGVQVRSQKIQPGDKIALHDTFIEIVPNSTIQSKPKPRQKRPQPQSPSRMQHHSSVQMPTHGNLAYQNQFPDHAQPHAMGTPHIGAVPQGASQAVPGFATWLERYVNEVVLPGAYKLLDWFEYRWVIGIFVTLFVVFVTALSTVPLMRILKGSVEQESQRRALTIARIVADKNRTILLQGLSSGVTTDFAEREPGVKKAYVISSDGSIIAPTALVGQQPPESFIHSARKLGKESVEQLDDSTIGSLVPISYYNPNTGAQTTTAYAVVLYDMGALAVDDGRTLSLFVQILFIAIVLGAILLFFLIKVVEFPIVSLNHQLDAGLRDGNLNLNSEFMFPELQRLITNINSAVNREAGGFAGANSPQFELDRTSEAQNIVNMIGFPGVAVNGTDKTIMAINSHFQDQIAGSQQWPGLKIDQILDQALKLNVQSLFDRVTASPHDIATDQLEISNNIYDLSAQAVHGAKGIAYVVISFTPKGGPA